MVKKRDKIARDNNQKYQLLVWLFFLVCGVLNAQDNPCNAIVLNTDMIDYIPFSNESLSQSSVSQPPFGNLQGPDIWFRFTKTGTEPLYILTEELTMLNPAIAIYTGTCDDLSLHYNITNNNCDQSSSPQNQFDALETNTTYWIRLWSENNMGNGSFGIRLTQNLDPIVNFTTFGDANLVGDCIWLTPFANNQIGCAWYQQEIDFNFPFTHTMSANFGFLNNGADGICLVYQSNGPDYCGGQGVGIGAGFMPNSAIFEFDTFKNSIYNDPDDDHCSFNVNGDMDHNNSIAGPVSLGNIETFNDHEIIFKWNPVGFIYELFFDGALILTGSYDMVTNCFNGNSKAYWGYTAATGGAVAAHIICPIFPEYDLGTQSYSQLIICHDEEYNGYTESQFIVEFEDGDNDCTHQNNIDLIVLPENEPRFLDTIMCAGMFFEYDGVTYQDTGKFVITSFDENFCSELIHVDFSYYPNEVMLDFKDSLSCNDDFDLVKMILHNDQEVVWTTPSEEEINSNEFLPTESGTFLYTVTNQFDCELIDSIQIYHPGFYPIFNIADGYIDCNTPETNLELSLISDYESVLWSGPFGYNSIELNPTIGVGGIYNVSIDVAGECDIDTSLFVTESFETPVLDIKNDTLTCLDSLAQIEFEVVPADYVLYYPDGSSTDVVFGDLTDPGIYELEVTGLNGCVELYEIEIVDNKIYPEVELLTEQQLILAMGQKDSIKLAYNDTSKIVIEWNPMLGLSCGDCLDVELTESGIDRYVVSVTNEYGCTTTEIIEIRVFDQNKVYIPNIFRPSDDQFIQSHFRPFVNEYIISIEEFLVFDRWGNQVYQSGIITDLNNYVGWNGQFNNRVCQSGVYAYFVRFVDEEGEVFETSGTVTLVN